MLRFKNKKGVWIICGILGALALITAFTFLNERITAWINGDAFRAMLDQETSKGLKLTAHYSPLTRVGFLGMHADSFDGNNGLKTIISIQAYDISGNFNPLGVGLHRWQLENIHLKSGSVTLQKTEPTPGAPKGPTPMPWWGLFWPYRVYLADVKVDSADILWHLQGKESGIYGTFLEVTPNGRDFEYDARGGVFTTPITPNLLVRHIHLLVRKPRLYCEDLVLGDDSAHPAQQVRLTGDAGLQDDRSIKLKADLTGLGVSVWMPEKLRAHVSGHASGHFDYASVSTGLENATGQGHLTIADGDLHDLAPVRNYVKVTGSPNPGDLALKVCQADLHWQGGALSAENIEVECDGVFRLTGTITMAQDKTLTGELEFGLTDPYLHWLPTAKQTIFTREEGQYHFATIHLGGTLQKPTEDLSTRVAKEVEKSPLLALKLFFNEAGSWLDFN